MLQVLVKESEGPVEHLVKIGTSARVLEELRVTSKPAKVKGKAGRRKQKAAVEDLDDDVAEAEEQPGVRPRHHSLMRTRGHAGSAAGDVCSSG